LQSVRRLSPQVALLSILDCGVVQAIITDQHPLVLQRTVWQIQRKADLFLQKFWEQAEVSDTVSGSTTPREAGCFAVSGLLAAFSSSSNIVRHGVCHVHLTASLGSNIPRPNVQSDCINSETWDNKADTRVFTTWAERRHRVEARRTVG